MSYVDSTPVAVRQLDGDVPSGGAGRFACPMCGDRFRRLEHMYRHKVGSHTNNRPFTCLSCGRKFARRSVRYRCLLTQRKALLQNLPRLLLA